MKKLICQGYNKNNTKCTNAAVWLFHTEYQGGETNVHLCSKCKNIFLKQHSAFNTTITPLYEKVTK